MVLAFGDYEVDVDLFEVRRSGTRLAVEPQVFDILRYLITHRDRVVTKEELLDNIWGDRFVSEAALTSRIKAARRAVGDDGKRQQLIRTVHGRGYRFLAAVAERTQPVGEPPEETDEGVSAPATPPLPQPVSSFVGREADVAGVAGELSRGRLVTVCGTGGVGKTRLALEVAARVRRDYPDGVGMLRLAPLEAGAEVEVAVASAMGVQPRHGSSILDRLAEALAERRMLIVVDNCEHVINSVARVVETVIERTSGVDVLATSRAPLDLDGERVWRLAPLPVDLDGGGDSPAVRLFVDRARAQLPGHPFGEDDHRIVQAICRQVGGIPLCIELAAVRVRHRDLRGVLASLADEATLTGGRRTAEERHRSLDALVAWSYDRLPDTQQRLFTRLCLFAAPFDTESAIAVTCGDDLPAHRIPELLWRLVDESLVQTDAAAPELYSVLVPVREFGRRRLAAHDGWGAWPRRHASWALSAAETADVALRGASAADAMAKFDRILPELRVARSVFREDSNLDAQTRTSRATFWFAQERMHAEALGWAGDAISSAREADHPGLAVLLAATTVAAWQRGDMDAARRLGREAIEAAGDRVEGRLAYLADAEVRQLDGEIEAGVALAERAAALAGEADDPLLLTLALVSQSLLLAAGGSTGAARARADRALAVAGEAGSPLAQAWALYAAGEIRLEEDADAATAYLDQALELARELDARVLVGVAGLSAITLRARRRDPASAVESFPELLDHWRRGGAWTHQWATLRNLVEVLARLGIDGPSARLYGAARTSMRARPPHGPEAVRLERAMTAVRSRLGAERFDAEVSAGARLDDEAAVAFARNTLTANEDSVFLRP